MYFPLSQDQEPPRDLHVEVRVLEDCGELMTDLGAVRLERDTTHYLRRVDVAQHIRRGDLQQTEYKE